MRVIRGEPVDVWLRHGRPARFVWRGRMYTVMFVLNRRLVTADEPGAAEPAVTEPAVTGPTLAGAAVAGPADPGPADPEPALGRPASAGSQVAGCDTVTADRREPAANGHEYWRVEATPERTVPPTTYELVHDLASDRWSLSRS